jgi:hypothetical protein
MRHVLCVCALVLLSACYGSRPAIPGEPMRNGGASLPGSMPQEAPRHMAAGQSVCRELSRTRCAANECKGANMDYVTLSCSGGRKVNRCVANVRCSEG